MNTKNLKPSRFDWPTSGTKYNKTEDQKLELKETSEKIEWEDIRDKKPLPFSQGFAIKTAIEQLPLQNASHGGWTYHPQGQMIAIRKDFTNATIEFHALDTGVELIPVMTKVFEIEKTTQN